MELLGCSGVRFEVLWGSLRRLRGCFFLAQGGLLSDNREKLDFDYFLYELAMFWGPWGFQNEVHIESQTAKMRGEEEQRAREESGKRFWGGKSSILDTVCVSGEPWS